MAKYAPNASGHEKMSQYDKKTDGEPKLLLVHHFMEFGSKPYICHDICGGYEFKISRLRCRAIPLPETGLQSGPLCYIEAVLDSIRHCREEVEFISDLVLNV